MIINQKGVRCKTFVACRNPAMENSFDAEKYSKHGQDNGRKEGCNKVFFLKFPICIRKLWTRYKMKGVKL